MSLPRYVPWFDWDEWLVVSNDFYSNDSQSQRKAVEIVKLWNIRGRLPHAVDCTAQLTETILSDQEGHLSETQLQSLYSFTVIRSVNGLVDGFQQGLFAESIYNLASRINLPGWIVEIRHDATHNSMPSLTVLRTAASTLLAWLNDQYWRPQYAYIMSITEQFASHLSSGVPLSSSFPSLLTHSMIVQFLIPLLLDTIHNHPVNFSDIKSINDSTEKPSSSTCNLSLLVPKCVMEICANNPKVTLILISHLLGLVIDTVSSSEESSSQAPSVATHSPKLALYINSSICLLREHISTSPSTSNSTPYELRNDSSTEIIRRQIDRLNRFSAQQNHIFQIYDGIHDLRSLSGVALELANSNISEKNDTNLIGISEPILGGLIGANIARMKRKKKRKAAMDDLRVEDDSATHSTSPWSAGNIEAEDVITQSCKTPSLLEGTASDHNEQIYYSIFGIPAKWRVVEKTDCWPMGVQFSGRC